MSQELLERSIKQFRKAGNDYSTSDQTTRAGILKTYKDALDLLDPRLTEDESERLKAAQVAFEDDATEKTQAEFQALIKEIADRRDPNVRKNRRNTILLSLLALAGGFTLMVGALPFTLFFAIPAFIAAALLGAAYNLYKNGNKKWAIGLAVAGIMAASILFAPLLAPLVGGLVGASIIMPFAALGAVLGVVVAVAAAAAILYGLYKAAVALYEAVAAIAKNPALLAATVIVAAVVGIGMIMFTGASLGIGLGALGTLALPIGAIVVAAAALIALAALAYHFRDSLSRAFTTVAEFFFDKKPANKQGLSAEMKLGRALTLVAVVGVGLTVAAALPIAVLGFPLVVVIGVALGAVSLLALVGNALYEIFRGDKPAATVTNTVAPTSSAQRTSQTNPQNTAEQKAAQLPNKDPTVLAIKAACKKENIVLPADVTFQRGHMESGQRIVIAKGNNFEKEFHVFKNQGAIVVNDLEKGTSNTVRAVVGEVVKGVETEAHKVETAIRSAVNLPDVALFLIVNDDKNQNHPTVVAIKNDGSISGKYRIDIHSTSKKIEGVTEIPDTGDEIVHNLGSVPSQPVPVPHREQAPVSSHGDRKHTVTKPTSEEVAALQVVMANEFGDANVELVQNDTEGQDGFPYMDQAYNNDVFKFKPLVGGGIEVTVGAYRDGALVTEPGLKISRGQIEAQMRATGAAESKGVSTTLDLSSRLGGNPEVGAKSHNGSVQPLASSMPSAMAQAGNGQKSSGVVSPTQSRTDVPTPQTGGFNNG